jgi:diaminopimelate decarboxylase
VEQFQRVRKAFAALNPLVCFSMKANDNSAVLKTLMKQGAGFDIVSGGALVKTQKLKADPQKIVFASVVKTEDEIIAGLKAGVLFFTVESLPELENINRLAKKLGVRAAIALRINPDVKAVTHERIVTGTLDKKFGLDLTTAKDILLHQTPYTHVDINGIHMHIGSQITDVTPYVTALKRVIKFLDDLTRQDVYVKYLDLGGGFGINYDGSSVAPIETFAKALIPLLEETGLDIIVEPGRFICGNAGIFVTQTLYVKDNGVKKFLIVDSGMNDFPRPSLYDAYHEIIPVKKTSSTKRDTVDVVGPICESGDYFAKKRRMPVVKQGDLLALKGAGAYCAVMASNYNSRGRAPEVMVKGNRFHIVKKRETIQDLMKEESLPKFI